MKITGIYKLPEIKHAFLIVASLDEFSDNSKLSQESKRRMEYFEHILRSKENKKTKDIPQWTLKVVSEKDFLTVLKQQHPKGLISSNQSSPNPEYLELLAINLLKTSKNESELKQRKTLSLIPDEDIIEVFI